MMGAENGTGALSWLADVERQRRAAGLRRALRPRPPSSDLLDLASNDYLGLSTHPAVVDGAVAALRTWGAGATGSRLVTGDTDLHQQFERELAAFVGAEAGLVFSSGYAANIGAVVSLSGPDALLVSDRYSHASLVDACRLSRARVVVTPHRDVDAVAAALAARTERRAVVVTESVFSADGTRAPLRELHAVCRRHGALLIVDEAHGLGVRGAGGQGLVHEVGLAGAPDIVLTTTMSKALGSQGGAVLGPAAVRDHLIDAARTFIFDTGLAPAAVGAALAALRVLVAQPALPAAVLDNARVLAEACGVCEPLGQCGGSSFASPSSSLAKPPGQCGGSSFASPSSSLAKPLGQCGGSSFASPSSSLAKPPESAVISVILGDPEVAVAAAAACLDAGVRVGCFRPPTVPVGTSRLRLTARASLTRDELDMAGRVLAGVLSAART
ncbi:8-amino-7-oxononanoate synthase [Mycolicibacter acidiphilus]|uniref:8-amino-7-oxononanoate synthase n=1 Tax=Mycolicibacter acidiphilus TaxID=2835306 RepID=UPI0020231583|nr:8-amino-7-oxononanoate synthase [Mycolicibacter acidiphilus]